MGRSAVVFRSAEALRRQFPSADLQVNPATGEPQSDAPLEELVSLHARIGDVDAVARLREAAALVLPTDSVMLSVVLASGSGSGDYVSRPQLRRLAQELTVLGVAHDAQVIEFVEQMEHLLAAAEREQTTIVFV